MGFFTQGQRVLQFYIFLAFHCIFIRPQYIGDWTLIQSTEGNLLEKIETQAILKWIWLNEN